mgnify:CR=1 FL=1
MPNYRSESIDRLFRAFMTLDNLEDCYAFFDDICTISELQDMAQRLDTAVMLDEGMNYQTISQQVGVSTATISRVSKCLNYGSGGYRDALDKLYRSQEKK